MSPRSVLTLLALCALLAGCVADEAPAAPTPAQASPEPQAEAAAAAAPVAQPGNATAPEPAPPAEERVPLVLDGKIGSQVVGCLGAGSAIQCVGAPISQDAAHLETPVEGQAVAAALVVTWTPTSPFTERLAVIIESAGAWHAAMGTSPLTLDVEELGFPAGEPVSVRVAPVRGGVHLPGAASTSVLVTPQDQPFRLEGHLLVRPSSG